MILPSGSRIFSRLFSKLPRRAPCEHERETAWNSIYTLGSLCEQFPPLFLFLGGSVRGRYIVLSCRSNLEPFDRFPVTCSVDTRNVKLGPESCSSYRRISNNQLFKQKGGRTSDSTQPQKLGIRCVLYEIYLGFAPVRTYDDSSSFSTGLRFLTDL